VAHRRSNVIALVALALAAACLAFASEAHASEDVRAAGTCGRGASSSLRLKADDGVIRVRFRVESNRRHARWQVVIAREGRVVWRGRVRSDGGGSLRVRRRIRDLPGADQVIARALGPHGITCIAAATLED
jgi:hypothetical protein